MSQPPSPSRPSAAEDRKARLAANLRANLKRRKAQARAMGATEEPADESQGDQPLA
ncbi:hypothetical protein [Blastomonas sp. AAP53]|uniref:hypothetical protein n=1 Tax=Blastomonas sp. AAP53 TaxID=1248760 RepID=UPI0002EC8D57|nr:hypothetical protein [Blastomonas sp. AAP53]